MEMRQEPAILSFDNINSMTGEVWRSGNGNDIVFVTSTLPIRPRLVKWYAEQLCVTPKYLSEICKKQSRRSAIEWIKGYAVLDINRMITTTSLSIKQITFELKYPNLPFLQ